MVRKDGRLDKTWSARALCLESFETKLASILCKKISLELIGNICCILSLHLQKIKLAISERSWFVDLLKTSAS